MPRNAGQRKATLVRPSPRTALVTPTGLSVRPPMSRLAGRQGSSIASGIRATPSLSALAGVAARPAPQQLNQRSLGTVPTGRRSRTCSTSSGRRSVLSTRQQCDRAEQQEAVAVERLQKARHSARPVSWSGWRGGSGRRRGKTSRMSRRPLGLRPDPGGRVVRRLREGPFTADSGANLGCLRASCCPARHEKDSSWHPRPFPSCSDTGHVCRCLPNPSTSEYALWDDQPAPGSALGAGRAAGAARQCDPAVDLAELSGHSAGNHRIRLGRRERRQRGQ